MSSVSKASSRRSAGTRDQFGESVRSFNTEPAGLESSRRSSLPLLPLCPQLMVPDGTRLKCVLQEAVCRKRQDLTFNISGVAAHGGAPLFQVRVVETSPAGGACGIYVETLGGKEQFAFLSTQEMWSEDQERIPKFNIMRPGGLLYAFMQKNSQGEYAIRCGQENMLTFTGDFLAHDVQVRGVAGQAVALVSGGGEGEYEVQVNPRSDAGLVVLGLLAIDKYERLPTPPASVSIHANSPGSAAGNPFDSSGELAPPAIGPDAGFGPGELATDAQA